MQFSNRNQPHILEVNLFVNINIIIDKTLLYDILNFNFNVRRENKLLGKISEKEDDKNEITFNEKNIGNKMIKLLLVLYLHYLDMEKIIKGEIKFNGKRQYYLINLFL